MLVAQHKSKNNLQTQVKGLLSSFFSCLSLFSYLPSLHHLAQAMLVDLQQDS